MKKMLLLLTVAALGFASAQAQTTPPANGGTFQGRGMGREQRTPEQRADMQTQRLTTQLGLTPEQQPKVRAIFLAQANELDAARANRTPGSVDREALRQKMQEGRARYDEQLRAVLTPEQFGKYQQQRAERLERAGDMKEARKDGKLKAKKDKVKTKAS